LQHLLQQRSSLHTQRTYLFAGRVLHPVSAGRQPGRLIEALARPGGRRVRHCDVATGQRGRLLRCHAEEADRALKAASSTTVVRLLKHLARLARELLHPAGGPGLLWGAGCCRLRLLLGLFCGPFPPSCFCFAAAALSWRNCLHWALCAAPHCALWHCLPQQLTCLQAAQCANSTAGPASWRQCAH
jgi:hypothetical protein